MGGKRDEINRAGRVAILTKGKSVSPSKGLPPAFGIADRKINAAADVVADYGTLAATSFLRYSVRMPEHAIHAQGFGVIAGCADVVEDAMQKQRIAKLRAGFRAQPRIRHDSRLHFLGGVINAREHLPRRVAHHGIAAMSEATKTVFVIPQMDYCRLKLAQEGQASEQVIRHRFRAVGVIGVTPCPGAERGHVGEVTEMQDGRGLVCLTEFKHGPGGL